MPPGPHPLNLGTMTTLAFFLVVLPRLLLAIVVVPFLALGGLLLLPLFGLPWFISVYTRLSIFFVFNDCFDKCTSVLRRSLGASALPELKRDALRLPLPTPRRSLLLSCPLRERDRYVTELDLLRSGIVGDGLTLRDSLVGTIEDY